MEGSEGVAGPIKSQKPIWRTRLFALFIVVIVIIATIAAVMLTQPPSSSSPSLQTIHNNHQGLKDGDYFLYDATGWYNNTTITGFYQVNLTGDVTPTSIGGYNFLNSSVPELNSLVNYQLNILGPQGHIIGEEKINTSFGIKAVAEMFNPFDGWAAVYLIGYDPEVVYECFVNGPDFHLQLMLNQTNNAYAAANNTVPFAIQGIQQSTNESISLGFLGGGESFGQFFNLSIGGRYSYNFTADNLSMYAYSEANMLSMAQGSNYVCYPQLTRSLANNETGVAYLPSGYFMIVYFSHGMSNETGYFGCHLEVY